MEIKFDTREIDRFASALARVSADGARLAITQAVNDVAFEARKRVQSELQARLDRPTPYTQRGVLVAKATPEQANPTAVVGFDIVTVQDASGRAIDFRQTAPGETARANYLAPLTSGEPRKFKRFELALQASGAMPRGTFAVPAKGTKLDAFGNLPRGQIQQIISQVGTELLSGQNRTLRKRENETPKQFDKRRAKAYGKAGAQYVSYPNGRGKLPPGLYASSGAAGGAKGFKRSGSFRAVLFYVRGARYGQRFDFAGTLERTQREVLERQLNKRINSIVKKELRDGGSGTLGF